MQNEIDNQLEDGQAAAAAAANIQVDDVNRIALSATRSRLFIDCADLTDEATYTCVAENSFSRISSHTKLNLIKPVIQQQLPGNENDLINGSPLDEVAALELAAAAASAANGADQSFKQMDDNKSPSGAALSAVPQCLSQRVARSTGKFVNLCAQLFSLPYSIILTPSVLPNQQLNLSEYTCGPITSSRS